MTQVLTVGVALSWASVLLVLVLGARHGHAEYRRGYRAGRASRHCGDLCDVPVVVPGGQGLCARPCGHPGAHAAAWTEGARRW